VDSFRLPRLAFLPSLIRRETPVQSNFQEVVLARNVYEIDFLKVPEQFPCCCHPRNREVGEHSVQIFSISNRIFYFQGNFTSLVSSLPLF
jgi:hypothetical protein